MSLNVLKTNHQVAMRLGQLMEILKMFIRLLYKDANFHIYKIDENGIIKKNNEVLSNDDIMAALLLQEEEAKMK